MVDLLFFLISLTSIGITAVSNPVYSVFILIAIFLQTTVLFFLLGVEFFSILLITVYIGAIAVLFLFVVMLLDLRTVGEFDSKYYNPYRNSFLLNFFGLISIFLVYLVCIPTTTISLEINDYDNDPTLIIVQSLFYRTNIHSISELLYNYYMVYFFIVGLILLITIFGVVILVDELSKFNVSIVRKDLSMLIFEDRLTTDIFVAARYPLGGFTSHCLNETDHISWKNMQILSKSLQLDNALLKKSNFNVIRQTPFDLGWFPIIIPKKYSRIPWNRYAEKRLDEGDDDLLASIFDDKIESIQNRIKSDNDRAVKKE